VCVANRGVGFVHFERSEDALRAVTSLNDTVVCACVCCARARVYASVCVAGGLYRSALRQFCQDSRIRHKGVCAAVCACLCKCVCLYMHACALACLCMCVCVLAS